MTTLAKNLEHDRAFFDLLKFFWFLYIENPILIEKIFNDRAICVSSVMENAIRDQTGLEITSINGADFINDADAKYSTVTYQGNSAGYGVNIYAKGVKGKIYLIVHEQTTKKFYFFIIPNNAFNKKIAIPFTDNFEPKRQNKHRMNELWKFEVPSMKEFFENIKNENKS